MHLTRYNKKYLLLLLISYQMSFGTPQFMTYTTTPIDAHTQEVIITFTVDEKDYIYKDFITVSSHEPTLTLSPWKANKLPVAHYDSLFKETKHIFNEDFSISVMATAHEINDKPLYLYCSYYRRSDKKINQTLIPLIFTANTLINEHSYEKNIINESETNVTPKITPIHPSPIDDYYYVMLAITETIIQTFTTDHKKYFLLFILLIILFLLLSHFLKEQLEKQNVLKELTEVTISLFGLLATVYGLFYLNIISTPFITMSIACCSSLGTGLFYTKKSIKLQSRSLAALCTLIGTVGICSAIFLAFKIIQFF